MGETSEKPDDENISFGCYGFRPKRLQWLVSFLPFLFLICMNGFFQGAVVNGLISTSISTIEKRFNLTSFGSGFFAATYDIFVGLMLLPLTAASGMINKVRCIGWGMLLVAIGSLSIVLPEYLAGPYEVGEIKKDVCDLNRGNSTFCPVESNASSSSFIYFLLLLSQALIGIGASPLFTYGVSCIDGFDAHIRAGRNMACYMSASTLGPAIAFIFAGMGLWYWGDFLRTDPLAFGILNNADSRWIGVWWMGFAICGVLSLLTALPLTMFPRKLKDTDERKMNDIHRTDVSLNQQFSESVFGFLHIFKMFLKSPTVMCVVLMQTAESFLMNGYITFVPKLLETLFGYSSGTSSAITGLLVIPVGVFGSFVGGQISKFFHNKFKPSMKCVIFFSIASAVFSVCLLFRCESLNIVNVNYNSSSLSQFGVKDTCSSGCSCEDHFNPVCATDSKLTFMSPCHAGCPDSPDYVTGAKSWKNCSCSSNKSGEITKGFCQIQCQWEKIVFFALFAMMAFCIFATGPVMQSASLRVVHFNHRDQFVCFGWMWMRSLGSIPGAIGFGYIIDINCLYWQTDCHGSKCQYYNAKSLGLWFFVLTLIVKSVCVILLTIAIRNYKSISADDEDEPAQKSMSLGETLRMSFRKTLPKGMEPSTMVY